MFGNLHRIASRYIPLQTVLWYRFKSREPDERGHDQNTYYDPVEVRGSWQAVDTQDIQSMGLDTSIRPTISAPFSAVLHRIIWSSAANATM